MDAIPATRGRPPAPRIERVLAVERFRGDGAGEGTRVEISPLLADRLASAAAQADGSGEERPATLGTVAVRLPANAAMRLAHADLAQHRALAESHEALSSEPLAWLDSIAAAELAAGVLAAQTGERQLRALADEVQDLKAALAALPGSALGAHEPRLKSLLQELTRYARDARDSYAGLIGKPAFRERIDEAAERSLECWRELRELDTATRRQLQTLGSTSRFGEVQVEKARSLLQEHRQAQRALAVAGRALAAASVLRLVLGQPSKAEDDALESALRSLHEACEEDGELQRRLRSAESGARGDPYVGRGEFEANRAALRKLLDGLGSDLAVAQARVAAARAAMAEGFPAALEEGWLCVARVGDGATVELRSGSLAPAVDPRPADSA